MFSRYSLRLVVCLVVVASAAVRAADMFNVDVVEMVELSNGELLLKLRTVQQKRHGGSLVRLGDWEYHPGSDGAPGRLAATIVDGSPTGSIRTQAMKHWRGETTLAPADLKRLGANGPMELILNGRILGQVSFDGSRVSKGAVPKLPVVLRSVNTHSRYVTTLEIQTAEIQSHGSSLSVDGALKVVQPVGRANGTLSVTVAEADPDGVHSLARAHWLGEIELNIRLLEEAGVIPGARSQKFDLIINGDKLAEVSVSARKLTVTAASGCPANLAN